jgi:hypothetical protein
MGVLAATILPGWIVLPLGALLMLVVAVHVLAVRASPLLSGRRKRLRVAGGVLMIFVTALLTYALGLAPEVADPLKEPGRARAFVLIWLAIVGLVGILVAIAVVDALATASMGVQAHRNLARGMRAQIEADLVERAARAAGPAAGAGASEGGEPPRG